MVWKSCYISVLHTDPNSLSGGDNDAPPLVVGQCSLRWNLPLEQMQLSRNHRQGTNIKAPINNPQTNGSYFSPQKTPLMESITQNVITAISAITFFNAFVPSFGLVCLRHTSENSTTLYFVSFYGSRSYMLVYALVHMPHHWSRSHVSMTPGEKRKRGVSCFRDSWLGWNSKKSAEK